VAVIRLRGIDHVCLRVADLDEASARWCLQFGLVERSRSDGRALLACNDEPYSLELVEGGRPGHDHTAFELAHDCTVDDARAHLEAAGRVWEEREGSVFVTDPDGRSVQLAPFAAAASEVDRRPQHARPSTVVRLGGPRRLGHVNCLTGDIRGNASFYTDVLGMRVSDWLGDGGVWFHVNSDHHVMALVDMGYAHFHHLAFETVDIGKMRDLLDHLARHGRWLAWGPARHGIAGNIASYVRIVEEECLAELYCDMEQLQDGHVPRTYPDDRYSSNTWGPLPPRSYFRFDPVAIEFERESWETRGRQLPPPPEGWPT
jgi:catechol 2,3-dioxygenase-like lactoylglutathione lyase family enzyme